MHWNILTDRTSLIPKKAALTSSNPNLTTKWEMLQESSKNFDPIGYTALVTVHSKLFMQRFWQKLDLDEPLMTELCGEWQGILIKRP